MRICNSQFEIHISKFLMSEPEIARRCFSCGASVRQRAMFCPQCGNPIANEEHSTTITSASDTIIDNAPTEALRPDLAATQPLSAVVPQTPEIAPTQALNPTEHKAADHGVLSKVEHIRKVSSVMIDQAAYDPSLRFILVAAAFFILFLVLLILSKVIG